jgi:methylase of polypeptide subunit release factors
MIRRLLSQLPARLAPDGVAFVEIGADQGEAIGAEIHRMLDGWTFEVKQDLARHPRVARLHPPAARDRAGAEHGR